MLKKLAEDGKEMGYLLMLRKKYSGEGGSGAAAAA
jgi:hypothetical protein